MKVRVMVVREGPVNNIPLCSPEEVAQFLSKEARGLDREYCWRIDVDVRNRLLQYEVLSIGSLTASIIHPREVLKSAILASAAGFILVHNHPSGDPTPSREDKDITARLVKAGELMGVPLVDHVILGEEGHYSFRQHGLL